MSLLKSALAREIQIRNLTVSFSRRPALHHIDGIFQSNKLTAVVGPNGAGKSTLLRAIAGLEKIENGTLNFVNTKASNIAYIPQQSAIHRTDWNLTVFDFIALGQNHQFWPWHKIDRAKISESLSKINLPDIGEKSIAELSIGQFQRVIWARALQKDHDIYLLDEPFAPLDRLSVELMIEDLQEIVSKNKIVIVVVHDDRLVQSYFDETLLLNKEVQQWGPTAQVMSSQEWSNRFKFQKSFEFNVCDYE